MAYYFLRSRSHFYEPFAIKLNDLLACMSFFDKRTLTMPAKDQHRNPAGQAVADDYDVICIMPFCQWLQLAEWAIRHGAIIIAFRFT